MSRIPRLSNPPQSANYRPPNTNRPANPNRPPVQGPPRTPGNLNPGVPPQHNQGQAPAMRPSNQQAPALDMNNAATLTHGMNPNFVRPALENGRLSSAYERLGPNGNYHRPADRNGGGALGVYTRAQGVGQDTWRAQGHGVGSNPNNAQLVLNPNLLQNNPNWRASTTDNMGRVPGSTAANQAALPPGNPLQRTRPMWAQQTENGRNQNFNNTVAGTQPHQQNEQVHWQSIPLNNGNLRGILTTSPQTFNQMMQIPGAQPSGLRPPSAGNGIQGLGTVPVGNQRVPVVQAEPNSSQANALKLGGITDSTGHVR
ncbi:hypothetical protein LZ198_25795 [Myxococcus sp. K15C18031901]|uniref:hypothetical protein n=1 Tax=Myxococcus dinghuensis TaxID=2906761 RepID=UPI0020A74616|nr:hypothetical protein [Myxococcus dinghuensis]MCP3102288.1 hypothetical protein [Myxococcus dinghuensis]